MSKRKGFYLPGAGWLALVLIVVISLAGLNAGYNLLFLVSSFITAGLILNALVSFILMRSVQFELEHPDKTHRLTEYSYKITIHRRPRLARILSPVYLIRLAYSDERKKKRKEINKLFKNEEQPAALEYGADNQFFLTRQEQKRGLYRYIYMRIECEYPFGLVSFTRLFDFEQDFTVFPRLLPYRNLQMLFAESHWQNRSRPSFRKGDSNLIYGIREFMPGDPLKKVHWKALAKHNKIMVIEHEKEQHQAVTLLLPNICKQAIKNDGQKFEDALDLTYTLIHYHFEMRFAIDFIGAQPEPVHLRCRGDEKQKATIIRELSKAKPSEEPKNHQLLEYLTDRVSLRNQLVMVTTGLADDDNLAAELEQRGFHVWRQYGAPTYKVRRPKSRLLSAKGA